MRWTALFGSVALIGTLVFEPVPAKAQDVSRYPWCAMYNNGSESCTFSTLAQCRAAISGVGGSCGNNAYYSGSGSSRSYGGAYQRRAPRRRY